MTPGERCVYCRRRPVDQAWRPFCSERCQLADLWRWLDGGYRIAGGPLPTEDDDDAPPRTGGDTRR